MEYESKLDLVDEMAWEDSDKIIWVSLEDAGLENCDIDTVPMVQRQYFDEEK
jgi:hypothetical protein